ncbi:hypothetical protein ACWKT3_20855 [Streptomyces violaceus]
MTSRNGTLRLLERASGAAVRTLKVEGTLNYAAVDDDGKNAAWWTRSTPRCGSSAWPRAARTS